MTSDRETLRNRVIEFYINCCYSADLWEVEETKDRVERIDYVKGYNRYGEHFEPGFQGLEPGDSE